jgi:hypothetical protein
MRIPVGKTHQKIAGGRSFGSVLNGPVSLQCGASSPLSQRPKSGDK